MTAQDQTKEVRDVVYLEPGDCWRKKVTGTRTLQNKAVKMLLCCRDATLDKNAASPLKAAVAFGVRDITQLRQKVHSRGYHRLRVERILRSA